MAARGDLGGDVGCDGARVERPGVAPPQALERERSLRAREPAEPRAAGPGQAFPRQAQRALLFRGQRERALDAQR